MSLDNLIEHELQHVNKYVNNPTSLQMARISLIDGKLEEQNNGINIILFGKLFNYNISIMIKYLGSN